MVTKSTPKRKAALKKKCILSPSTKKKIARILLRRFWRVSVKREARSTYNSEHFYIRSLSVKNKLKKKTAHKNLGLSWKFLCKKNHGHDFRKKRSDVLSDCTKNTVRNFFNRVCLPWRRTLIPYEREKIGLLSHDVIKRIYLCISA